MKMGLVNIIILNNYLVIVTFYLPIKACDDL